MNTHIDNLAYLYQEYMDTEDEFQDIVCTFNDDTGLIGKPLSEISLDIPYQDSKTFIKDNFDRLNETEEEKIEREAIEEESRLSIAKYTKEHEARLYSLIKKHNGSMDKEIKSWNGEYRIDYPASRGRKK